MTGPPVPAPGHLDLDGLADVLAGEDVDRHDAAHLTGCADCQDRLAALGAAEEQVVRALEALPEPALPEGFDDRVAHALQAVRHGPAAAEISRAGSASAGTAGSGTAAGVTAPAGAAGSGAAVGAAAAPPAPTASTGAPARGAHVVALPRRHRRAWLPAAAASLVLVLGGALGWTVLARSPGGGGESATSAAGGGAGPESSGSGGAELAQPASPDSAAGDSAAGDSAAEPDGAGAVTLAQAPPPRSATGVDYADPVQRAAALPQVLSPQPGEATREQDAVDPARLPTAANALERLREPEALAACLSAVTPDGQPPLAVDEGRYDGAPALAVVLPSDQPDEVLVHVVGPDCAAEDADTRLVTPVPRP